MSCSSTPFSNHFFYGCENKAIELLSTNSDMAHTKKFTVEIRSSQQIKMTDRELLAALNVVLSAEKAKCGWGEIVVLEAPTNNFELSESETESRKKLIDEDIKKLKSQMYDIGRCWGVLFKEGDSEGDYLHANNFNLFINRVNRLIGKIEANG